MFFCCNEEPKEKSEKTVPKAEENDGIGLDFTEALVFTCAPYPGEQHASQPHSPHSDHGR